MIKQSYTREFGASPSFIWKNAEIAVANQINVSWETYNTASQKYLPFNYVRIVNNGEADIWFYPNQDTSNPHYITKGSIVSYDRRTIPALSSFAVKRATATTITADKIIISCSKELEGTDSIVARLHKRLTRGVR